ncbi:HAD-IB family hydrolase [Sharpea porci]|uniref:HAD-IB family hydrolase n=1 Tax=Sharpea porci TaxID=2652286 RepID=UPI0024091422|nr:HAD-IB family hydrolase [Sharpea porci]MDD6712399.1 HAD-IB family hydrolase [Sharpea porci]MDY5280136.1 HAD-IB family hydrolase [Sharpea porci]
MKSVKCAFFDFDNTIAKGDTIYKLLVYTIKKHPLTIVRFLLTILYGIGYILHLVSKEKLKETILFPLDLFNSEELKTFYQEKVVPSYYPHMVQELQKRKDEGYLVFLVTASSEAYMRFNELPIDILMGTQTEIIDGEYTSHIVGKNCKDAHKVERINAYLEKNNLSIDYEHSYGYSDSTSDIPMLKLVKNRVRISKKDGSMSPFVF